MIGSKEEALKILLNNPHEWTDEFDDDVVKFSLVVGSYLGKSHNGYSFICWPDYESNPFSESRAFRYWVNEDTGEIAEEDVPFFPEEARELYQKHFFGSDQAEPPKEQTLASA